MDTRDSPMCLSWLSSQQGESGAIRLKGSDRLVKRDGSNWLVYPLAPAFAFAEALSYGWFN